MLDSEEAEKEMEVEPRKPRCNGPTDKQIETRLADGRRRITPLFIPPPPDMGEEKAKEIIITPVTKTKESSLPPKTHPSETTTPPSSLKRKAESQVSGKPEKKKPGRPPLSQSQEQTPKSVPAEKAIVPEKIAAPERTSHLNSAVHLPSLKVDKTSNVLKTELTLTLSTVCSVAKKTMFCNEDNSNEAEKEMDVEAIKPRCNVSDQRLLTNEYLMWENHDKNVCWLDASMALLAHNKILQKAVNDDTAKSSTLKNIITTYHEQISLINAVQPVEYSSSAVKEARNIFRQMQDSCEDYLQPLLKYKRGEQESAFCSLYNLIKEDKYLQRLLDVEFVWFLHCNKCGSYREKKLKKCIITVSNVKTFIPQSPVTICICPKCKEPGQNMTLEYKSLPQSILFHFENGAGTGKFNVSDFELHEQKYHVTGVMLWKKTQNITVNHFVTFIRDSFTDTWLECDDLKSDFGSFSNILPAIKLQEVYIIMLEAGESNKVLKWPLMVELKDKLCSENINNVEVPCVYVDLSEEIEDNSKENKEFTHL